nr:DEAD/DEAH box helicase family protein [Saprospiraceae bacterium]
MKVLTNLFAGNEIRQQVLDDLTLISSPNEVIKSWAGNFILIKESSTTEGLRNPQVGAIHSILSHWTHSSEIGTVVLPTGTGKTETMLSVLISEQIEKLLVIVPTDPLRSQIANKFLTLGLLPKLGIINKSTIYPVVGTIRKSFVDTTELNDFLSRCNVVVATASIISRMTPSLLKELKNSVTTIFIDEAHHTEATSWNRLRDNFSDKRVIQFTATPFRNDNKKI